MKKFKFRSYSEWVTYERKLRPEQRIHLWFRVIIWTGFFVSLGFSHFWVSVLLYFFATKVYIGTKPLPTDKTIQNLSTNVSTEDLINLTHERANDLEGHINDPNRLLFVHLFLRLDELQRLNLHNIETNERLKQRTDEINEKIRTMEGHRGPSLIQ